MNSERLIQGLRKLGYRCREHAQELRRRADHEDSRAEAYDHAAAQVLQEAGESLNKAFIGDVNKAPASGCDAQEVRRG